jgi:two-component system chemotaxis response regulator CheY
MATILVVDDSAVSRRLLCYTLNQYGHTTTAASDGQLALWHLEQQTFDLMIADLSMPEMDGLALVRHVRAGSSHQHMPVIMLTASGEDQDRIAAQASGANDFLTKPTSSRDLIATVERLLS